MKNKALIISMTSLFAMILTGCGGGNNPIGGGGGSSYSYNYNTPGPNKTHIHAFDFGGGIGNLWFDKAIDRFAQANMETSYAPGKKGVYIDYESSFKSNSESMASSGINIFFDERFSDITELGQAGLLLNLDDIVLDTSRKGGSLDSKIFENVKDGLKVQGSYYGLPHYEYYGGLTYNREIFDKLNAYFSYEHTLEREWECDYGIGYFVLDDKDVKSAGPDGKMGTMDDGLPATIQEFILLMDYLKQNDMPPIVLSGQYKIKYADLLLGGLWSSLAGADQMRNYFNCTGRIEVVKRDASRNIIFKKDASGNDLYLINTSKCSIRCPETEWIDMAEDGRDGYLGNDMVAKYYAIALVDIIDREGFFNSHISKGTHSHYDAQKDLYLGGITTEAKKAAMLIDGTYWYNESEEHFCFDDFTLFTKRDKNSLDVRWMQLPTEPLNSDNFVGKEQCLLDMGQAYGFINGNIAGNPELKQACLDLMAFLYSEDELIAFSTETGMARMIDYPMSKQAMENSGPFYAKLFQQRNANYDNVVALSGSTKAFKDKKSVIKIALQTTPFVDKDEGKSILALTSKYGAEEIFNKYSIDKDRWNYPVK